MMVVTPGRLGGAGKLSANQYMGGGTSEGWIFGGILLQEWIRYALRLLRLLP
jgi:hypothetical protein